jgi:hypothetical protein
MPSALSAGEAGNIPGFDFHGIAGNFEATPYPPLPFYRVESTRLRKLLRNRLPVYPCFSKAQAWKGHSNLNIDERSHFKDVLSIFGTGIALQSLKLHVQRPSSKHPLRSQ